MDQFEKLFNRTLRYLSYRPRSEKEVREYLQKKKAESPTIEKIVAKLKEHKFINDEEFAQWFVRSRTASKPKAARIIKMELRRKGISEEILGEVINDEGLRINDLENAKRLLDKKIDKYKSLDRNEIYKKLGGFLARRGFDWEVVKKAIDESFGKVV